MIQQTQPVTQPSQQSAAPTQKEHVVVAGETVEQIAKNYDVPAKYLRQLNKLSGPVQPQQKLRIPMARTAAASMPRPVYPGENNASTRDANAQQERHPGGTK